MTGVLAELERAICPTAPGLPQVGADSGTAEGDGLMAVLGQG
jgi:hypothetical protein